MMENIQLLSGKVLNCEIVSEMLSPGESISEGRFFVDPFRKNFPGY